MKRFVLVFSLVLGCSERTGADSPAPVDQEAPIIKCANRNFKIPFRIDPPEVNKYEILELWVSRDEGVRWEKAGQAKPEDGHFVFRASGDGMHWFAVRTRDTQGRMYPGDDEQVRPVMKVLIHSESSVVTPSAPVGEKAPVIEQAYRALRIPVAIDPADTTVYESFELWASRDEGKTWLLADVGYPKDGYLTYRITDEGMHWFAIRSRDAKGRMFPEDEKQLQVAVRIFIDSEPHPVGVNPPQLIPKFAELYRSPQPLDLMIAYRLFLTFGKLGGSACGVGGLAGHR